MNKPNYTTFYIVRHGETDWNKEGRAQGQTDIPLNETGKLQAKNIAQELKHITFYHAYSSDLLRAKHTAETIALEHTLTVVTTKLLRERNFGEYEGQTIRLTKIFDELVGNMSHEEKFKFKIKPDIESDHELITRLLNFIREAAFAHPGSTILVGTHGGILGALLIHLGFFDYVSRKHYVINNTSYIQLRTDGIDFFIDSVKGIEKRS